MGKIKYQKEILSLFEKSHVVSYKSIEKIVKSKKKTKQYPKQLVRNLLLSGKIKKLTKGFYTIFDDPSLAVFCFKPAYLGLQDALSFHNLWEQETIPIIITSNKARQGIRKILGSNVLIRRIDKKYFFGLDYFPQNNFCMPYSDIEKTFIDLIYFNKKLDKEIVEEIKKKISIKKLNAYLKVYPEKIKKKVLNSLSTQL